MNEEVQNPVISCSKLSKTFGGKKRFLMRDEPALLALDSVSLEVGKSEIVGLVGESGCGKSTLARALLRLIPIDEGQIYWGREEVSRYSQKELRPLRKDRQIVFQDPYNSLNPRMKVGQILSEPLHSLTNLSKEEVRQRVLEILEDVELDREFLRRFPHEFSGGQRQRIMIGRALMSNPEFLICDEAVSALDVSVQAQILQLLASLQKARGLSILFITHDLSVARHLCQRICVMHLGRIVEVAPTNAFFENPRHYYSQSLLRSVPVANPAKRKIQSTPFVRLERSSALRGKVGCPLRNTCPHSVQACHEETPKFEEHAPGHFVACHYKFPSDFV